MGGDAISSENFTVDELRDVVFGDSDRLSKSLALSLLAQKAYPNRIDDLQQVLQSNAEAAKIRHSAAIALSRIGTNEAQQVLLSNIDVENNLVLRGVLDGLAQIGNEETLQVIAARRQRLSSLRSAVQPEFSINNFMQDADRLDIVFPSTEQLLNVDVSQAETIALETATPATTRAAIASLSRRNLALDLAREQAFSIRCSGQTLLLLLNQAGLNQRLQPFRQGRTVFGVLAMEYTLEAETWEVKYYILTQSGSVRDQVDVVLVTSKGSPVFAGTADVRGSRAEFTIRAIERPGAAAVNIEGIYEAGSLQFSQAFGERRRRNQRVPSPRQGE
ncbi:hypothetical protein C7293_12800 [filamentous cyanobacterium CCT1]|nr:hypothetical protein C7293_12800 [filamentous cyanobacterium CCT1]PSN80012.1 hypothetical protein C8B47_08720 [filamentous cyanobacterium CCP4]